MLKIAFKTVAITLAVMIFLGLYYKVQAQTQDVAAYKFATLPDGTEVYKAVHQGCELFIAQNIHTQIQRSDSVAVSITTGRGCQ